MNPDPHNPNPKRLLSVEFQTEVDVATGAAERRMFVKMYFDARDSGLLASIGDINWRTLCCLATYMDENGNCYPSQALIAKDLGISRQKLNKRIQNLLAFRFQDRPVITMVKNRKSAQGGSRWANNVYRILPVCGFGMFDRPSVDQAQSLAAPSKSSMSPKGDTQRKTSMSPFRDTRKGDTNQNQEFNKTVNVNEPSKTLKDPEKEEALVFEMLDVLGDRHSTGLYRRIARSVPDDLIFEVLSETKYQAQTGKIRKSRGAFFTNEIVRRAKSYGIDLGLR
jgi:hypothetical protein